MQKRIFKNMEWSILIYVILLAIIGLVAIFSATLDTNHEEFKKQLIWFGISIPVLIIILFIDYEFIGKLSPVFFGVSIVLVIGVFFTQPINGATRWYDFGAFSFQPTEVLKITFLIFLSYILVKLQEKGREEINRLLKLLLVFVIVAIPAVITALQPNFGDAVIFIVIGGLILFVSGLKARYIIIALLTIVILVPTLYFTILPSHAKDRIDVFLNPELDPRGKGYNAIQSKIAVGSGQLLGLGVGKGTQTQLGYLYPKTTDFIYAVISEEMGFIVSASVIILNVLLITKCISIAKTAKDTLGSYIAIGLTAIFIYHMTENIGMTIGMLPITGVPLLFVSYGGSALLTNMISIGLLLNISGRSNRKVGMFSD